jgi:hypothetical protein
VILLLATLAFADEEVHAVNAGESVEVSGPAVWMTEGRFRSYVADSRKLPACEEKLEEAINLSVEANERALKAREIALTEFHRAAEEDAQQVQLIAEQAVRIDELADKIERVRAQRNVAWGIAGGFIAASTAATVLALSN